MDGAFEVCDLQIVTNLLLDYTLDTLTVSAPLLCAALLSRARCAVFAPLTLHMPSTSSP